MKYLCHSCKLKTYCQPIPGEKDSMSFLDALVDKQALFHRHEYLYKASDPFKKIVMIRSGCVKTYKIDAQGEKQITGFCYPGELLGLNAIASGVYQEYAVALDTLSVCQLDYGELENLSSRFSCFKNQLIRLMSEALSNHFSPKLSSSAESKMALFLLNISEKMKNYGTNGMQFSLSMTREDIARYLGLASETVSRILSKFQLKNILECSKKHIHLKDYAQLQSLASQAG